MMTMTIDAMQVREATTTLLRDPASAHAECADMAQLAQEAFAVLTLLCRVRHNRVYAECQIMPRVGSGTPTVGVFGRTNSA